MKFAPHPDGHMMTSDFVLHFLLCANCFHSGHELDLNIYSAFFFEKFYEKPSLVDIKKATDHTISVVFSALEYRAVLAALLVMKEAENPLPVASVLWNRLVMMLYGAIKGLGATEPQPVDSKASGF